jgi:hypothetical protein
VEEKKRKGKERKLFGLDWIGSIYLFILERREKERYGMN